MLIEAFSKLDSSYQLIIAGEVYGSFEKYQMQIDQHPLRENISVFKCPDSGFVHDVRTVNAQEFRGW